MKKWKIDTGSSTEHFISQDQKKKKKEEKGEDRDIWRPEWGKSHNFILE